MQWVIALIAAELLNKFLSDTNSVGNCVVMKQYNVFTDTSTTLILNSIAKFLQCFTVSLCIDGFTSRMACSSTNTLNMIFHADNIVLIFGFVGENEYLDCFDFELT
ncbi:hypothetical protein TNCT_324091 [Trichonephila clavata]|uniref:Uncharacterized protein n=1 Tax=Trichonephila clavata TaxID=2740835 RepID=A0A8X6HZJ7_TRICU|nr:hypothetical protein TNCT_324091 [Trichonephila clavata]